MASLLAHGIRLTLVLGHSSVNAPGTSSALARQLIDRRGPYWTMSGRMGALKTFGRGCVSPLGLPSAEAMVTVGRVDILICLQLTMGGYVVELQLQQRLEDSGRITVCVRENLG